MTTEPMPAPANAPLPEAVLARVAFLFRRAGDDVTMQALQRAIVEYRKQAKEGE